MPNYMRNVLTLSCPNCGALVNFLDKHLIGSWFKFNTVIPQHESMDECPEEYLVSEDVMDNRLCEDPVF